MSDDGVREGEERLAAARSRKGGRPKGVSLGPHKSGETGNIFSPKIGRPPYNDVQGYLKTFEDLENRAPFVIPGSLEDVKAHNPVASTKPYWLAKGALEVAKSLEVVMIETSGGSTKFPERMLIAHAAILDDIFIALSKQAMTADSHERKMALLAEARKYEEAARAVAKQLLTLQIQKFDIIKQKYGKTAANEYYLTVNQLLINRGVDKNEGERN